MRAPYTVTRLVLLAVTLVGLFGFSVAWAQDTAESPDMAITQEEADAFAERFDQIFDGPQVEIADELFSPDFVGHLPLAPVLDRQGWKDYVVSFYQAFPDMTEEVNQVHTTGDRVIVHVTYTGTHQGPLFGIPPTGAEVTMDGIGIFAFDENGLATENWAVLDVVNVLAQIGAFPPALAGQAEASDMATDTESTILRFYEYANAGDTENQLALFADDAEFTLPDGTVLRGPDEIATFQPGHMQIEVTNLEVEGNTATWTSVTADGSFDLEAAVENGEIISMRFR